MINETAKIAKDVTKKKNSYTIVVITANKNAQSLVDKEDTAVLCKKWKNGHCDYIADHAGQGFDKIKS